VMGAMPRPRPQHLHRERTRHGRFVWYVRVGHGPRVRLSAEYGTPEFDAQYRAAISGRPSEPAGKAAAGSLAWLFDRYRETVAWTTLAAATRRQRENIMRVVLAQAGHEPATAIKRAHVVAGRDRRAETPAQARNFLDAMRGLFRWALDAGHVRVDPTLGIASPPRPKDNPGFPVWTEEDVARYEARWPMGTKERVWLDVLLYTGLRRGDAVQLGRQHVRDGVATLRTEKTGITVTIPILPALATTLAAGPCGELAFICGDAGRPFTKESFGNAFRDACRAAGVSKSAHGVRKIGATRAAENAATVAELEAIFGWQGGGMASLYTRAADRARLAKSAMPKMAGRTTSEHSIPAPSGKVRERPRKDQ
jgi:integrase